MKAKARQSLTRLVTITGFEDHITNGFPSRLHLFAKEAMYVGAQYLLSLALFRSSIGNRTPDR
jgi:hypothetical protein